MRLLVLTVAAALSALAPAYTRSANQQTVPPATGNAGRERPAVNIQETPDVPLRISVETKWATPNEQMLEIYVTVKNVARKPARAYAVRVDYGGVAEEGGGCFLDNTTKPGKILQPNQTAGRSTWRPVSPSDAQSAVDVTLDFVEFTDGSVWGLDTCQSAERLSGLRAGARVVKAHFRKKLVEKGVESLVNRLYADDPELTPPEERSDVWKAGFRGAINGIRERIRQANFEGGLPEVEAALQRPFDTSDN